MYLDVHFGMCLYTPLHADDRASLLPFETAAVNGAEVPMSGEIEYGRGQRKPAEKRLYFSEEDDDGATLPKQVWLFVDVDEQ